MTLRPWSSIPIHDRGEPLVPLPPALLRLEPHPYARLGAPYGAGRSPFQLRAGVIERLLSAQAQLRDWQPQWRLAIFDGWRPLAVQRFMVDHTMASECAARGLDWRVSSPERAAVEAEVARFWAPPSDDPATPPPHSTGAAVDLCLADQTGALIAMGSPIDAIGPVSEPEHFGRLAESLSDGEERHRALLWHHNRGLLRDAMEGAGFAQHPNEWWHFSYGDQLWAWRRGEPSACYGRCPEGGSAGRSE